MVAMLANRASFSGLLPILALNSLFDRPTTTIQIDVNNYSKIDLPKKQNLLCQTNLLYNNTAKTNQKNNKLNQIYQCICCISIQRCFRIFNNTALVIWWQEAWHNRYREKSKRIDLLARIMFPFFFLIFNIIVSFKR